MSGCNRSHLARVVFRLNQRSRTILRRLKPCAWASSRCCVDRIGTARLFSQFGGGVEDDVQRSDLRGLGVAIDRKRWPSLVTSYENDRWKKPGLGTGC